MTTNIAIVGIAEAGKTSFLTSLLWHFNAFDGTDRFQVRDSKNKIIDMQNGNIISNLNNNAFAYQMYRSQLTSAEFPQKTTDWSECTITYKTIRTKKRCWITKRFLPDQITHNHTVRFFDFSGERIADILMLDISDYRRWSNAMFNALRANTAAKEFVTAYEQTLQSAASLTLDICVTAYKTLMKELVLRNSRYVSPSTFMLDQHGTAWRNAANPTAFATRFSGMPQEEFAPLPNHIFNNTQHKFLVQKMQQHYTKYRQQIVLPAIGRLRSADKVLILIDVASMLMRGDLYYNDQQDAMLSILSALQTSRWVPKIHRPRNVAFIASQADRLRINDIQSGRVESFLKSITAVLRNKFKGMFQFEHFVCSAILSTIPDPQDPTRNIGKLKHDPKEKRPVSYEVPQIPPTVPAQLVQGSYKFPFLHPDVSNVNSEPPKHINLDTIFSYINK